LIKVLHATLAKLLLNGASMISAKYCSLQIIVMIAISLIIWSMVTLMF